MRFLLPCPSLGHPMVLPPPLLPRGLPYLQTGYVKPGEDGRGGGGRRADRKTGDARG